MGRFQLTLCLSFVLSRVFHWHLGSFLLLLALVGCTTATACGSKWQPTVWGLGCSLLTLGRRAGSRDFHSLLAPNLFGIPKISAPSCTSSGSCLYQRPGNNFRRVRRRSITSSSRLLGQAVVPRCLWLVCPASSPLLLVLGEDCGLCSSCCLYLSLISSVALG